MQQSTEIILSIIFMSIAVLVGMTLATQYVGASLQYNPSLLGKITEIGGIVLYWPWMFWSWMFKYQASHPEIFSIAYLLQILCGGFGLIFVVLLKKFAAPKAMEVKSFGDASWGDRRDAVKAGLIGNIDGVVVGRLGDEILKHDGAEHILVTGATRSGKGWGVVCPTLWNWKGSAIIYDPKCELWDLTAGKRSQKGNVVLYNPLLENSIRFNPLLTVRKGAGEIGDIQNIVQFLSNPDATAQQRNIWEESGKRLVVAIILHVLYSEPDDRKNLSVVRERVLDLDATLKSMMRTPHRLNKETNKPEVHPEIFRVAKSIFTKYKKFRESVAGTSETYLELWADELIAHSTSTNDFNVMDLLMGDKPLSIYLQIPYSDRERLAPLLRFTLSQITRRLFRDLKGEFKGKHRVLLCLEEFPTLGKVDFLEKDFGMVAGYGIKALLVCQSANTITKEYGPNSTIFDNCHVQISFASSDPKTQERMSKLAGSATEIRESVNQQKDKMGWKRGSAISYSEVTRPILTESQARELDEEHQLVIIGSTKPLKTQKVRAYNHEHIFKLKDIKPPKGNIAIGKFNSDWFGEEPKGDLLPMPKVKVEREGGEEMQDDMVYEAQKNQYHDLIEKHKKEQQKFEEPVNETDENEFLNMDDREV